MYHGANERIVLENKGNILVTMENFSLKVMSINCAVFDVGRIRVQKPARTGAILLRLCVSSSILRGKSRAFFFTCQIYSFLHIDDSIVRFCYEISRIFSFLIYLFLFDFICFDWMADEATVDCIFSLLHFHRSHDFRWLFPKCGDSMNSFTRCLFLQCK